MTEHFKSECERAAKQEQAKRQQAMAVARQNIEIAQLKKR